MGKELLVLAKSRKPGGFCVAGIEIDISSNGQRRLSNRWLRPVTEIKDNGDIGALPASACRDFGVLDLIELDFVEYSPAFGQPENWRWAETNITTLYKCNYTPELSQFIDPAKPLWFDDKTVRDDEISIHNTTGHNMTHSLMLVKPKKLSFLLSLNTRSNAPRIKASFEVNNRIYRNIPVTDPVIFRIFKNQFPLCPNNEVEKKLFHNDDYWLTMSLSPCFGPRNSRYVLVAAVIDKTSYLQRQYR
jgi:hypothetical protein